MSNSGFLISLGESIKKIRVKKNFTQSELAKACAFEKASMSRIEAGKTNLRILTLITIAKKLQVDVNELIPSFRRFVPVEMEREPDASSDASPQKVTGSRAPRQLKTRKPGSARRAKK